MKQTFILDENILEYGLSVPGGSPDPSRLLIEQILANCHHVAWDGELISRYMRRLSNLQSQFPSPVRAFRSMLSNSEKLVYVEEVPEVEHEDQVRDASDLPFVRLAAAVDAGAILATSDGPLRQSVIEARINNDHNFLVIPPEEALQWAGPELA